MPAKPKSSTGTPAGAPDQDAAPSAATPEPDANTDANTDEAPDAASAEAAPMNRAERRAKGKGRQPTQATSRGKVVGSHGPAHTQRNWANRRSGG